MTALWNADERNIYTVHPWSQHSGRNWKHGFSALHVTPLFVRLLGTQRWVRMFSAFPVVRERWWKHIRRV